MVNKILTICHFRSTTKHNLPNSTKSWPNPT